MNKFLRKFSVLILSGFLLAACGSDDATEPTPTTNEPEFPTDFSDKTVEQNKSELQNNGIELVNKITTLKNSSGIQTSIAFTEHLEGAELPENLEDGRVGSSRAISLMQLLAALGTGKSSPTKIVSGMRASAVEFESFQQYYDEIVGVYAYSKANDTWTYTKSGNKVVFQFPSTKTGTTNNAEYAVYDYKGTKISGGIEGDDYAGDYPTALKADLTIDGAKKMEYSFATGYDSKGTPTSVTTSIKIDSYTFLYELTNTITEAKLDFSLSEGSTVLFGFGARGKGAFNVDDFENSEDADDIITDGSAYFQILNIKFSGEVDSKALVSALDAADTKAEEAKAWNDNYKAIVFYADSKKKIADSEFYATVDGVNYVRECKPGDGNGDGVTQPGEQVCEYVEVPKEVVEVRIVFQDGSKSDLATYTEAGFDDLQDELDEFMDSFD